MLTSQELMLVPILVRSQYLQLSVIVNIISPSQGVIRKFEIRDGTSRFAIELARANSLCIAYMVLASIPT